MNRGFAFAIAHIRGGDDLGRAWYKAGKLERRTNTFNDFVDAAKGLIAQGYTAKGNVSASGGSAGGELMGVVVGGWQLARAAKVAAERLAGRFHLDPVGWYQTTTRDGSRSSAADAYLKPARSRKNLKVITGATASLRGSANFAAFSGLNSRSRLLTGASLMRLSIIAAL